MSQPESLPLTHLQAGQWGSILRLDMEEPLRGRLADLGFLPGSSVRFLFAAPSGNPRAYWIQGTIIALRNQDGQSVIVHPLYPNK